MRDKCNKLSDSFVSPVCNEGTHFIAQDLGELENLQQERGQQQEKGSPEINTNWRFPKALDTSDFPLLLGFWFLSRRISAVATCQGRTIFKLECQLPLTAIFIAIRSPSDFYILCLLRNQPHPWISHDSLIEEYLSAHRQQLILYK